MLSVEQVTFRYDRRSQPVLRNASLSLDAGQVGVLLGRNGCGKTTLMRTLLGLCTPESGRIAFDGRDLTAIDRRQRARVAAYVPQDLQFGGLRVYDAVMAGRVARFGIQPGADDRAAVDAALEDMEQRILRHARRLARTRGITVLCTLHDLNQALQCGDRLFLMQDGCIKYTGDGDILTPETVQEIFGARVRAAVIDGKKYLIGADDDEE